jgi:peptidoglycan/xylan/chitin deacetylase (PgdA/CDA1 family)
VSIFIFHRVLPQPDPLFPDEMSRDRFDQLLGWLGTWFNVMPLRDAVEHLRSGTLPPRAASITFDDGYADNYTEALPLLRKHGLHATFFIATGFLDGRRMWNDTLIESIRVAKLADLDLADLDLATVPIGTLEQKRAALRSIIPALKYLPVDAREAAVARVAERCATTLPNDLMMTSTQLRDLHAAGMGIGAHTVRHPILARCDDALARREIDESRSVLEDLLGERITLFAYPNGKLGSDYDVRHAEIVRSLGFDAAVSTNPGASRHGDDLFQLRRFTPWDQGQVRFALRLAQNVLTGSA